VSVLVLLLALVFVHLCLVAIRFYMQMFGREKLRPYSYMMTIQSLSGVRTVVDCLISEFTHVNNTNQET